MIVFLSSFFDDVELHEFSADLQVFIKYGVEVFVEEDEFEFVKSVAGFFFEFTENKDVVELYDTKDCGEVEDEFPEFLCGAGCVLKGVWSFEEEIFKSF